MCGRRLKTGLRNIWAMLLLLLVVASLYSSPLDELTEILESYELHTTNLQQNINSLSSRLTDLEVSYQKLTSLQKTSQSSLDKAKFTLAEQQEILTNSSGTLTLLKQQMTGLENGYKNMERKLKAYQVMTKVVIGGIAGYLLGDLISPLTDFEYTKFATLGLGIALSFLL